MLSGKKSVPTSVCETITVPETDWDKSHVGCPNATTLSNSHIACLVSPFPHQTVKKK